MKRERGSHVRSFPYVIIILKCEGDVGFFKTSPGNNKKGREVKYNQEWEREKKKQERERERLGDRMEIDSKGSGKSIQFLRKEKMFQLYIQVVFGLFPEISLHLPSSETSVREWQTRER